MPAGKEEVEDSENEGIEIKFLTNPTKFYCTDDLNGGENQEEIDEEEFQGAFCREMELGDLDSSGRPIPIPIEGSEIKIEADYIIEAVGQEPEFIDFTTDQLDLTKWNTIKVDELYFTSLSKTLAGGDCVTGSKSVIEAVAQGKIIASNIYDFLVKNLT